jgi:predicted O-methyltransferase YrrM
MWFDFQEVYKRIYDELKEDEIFIEVGSFLGDSTKYFCELIRQGEKPINFIQVDLWENADEYKDYLPKGVTDFQDLYLDNLKEYEDIITPYKMSSYDASLTIPNNLIGAVFIDAAHDYDNVKLDIDCWVKKLKDGGIIAGHDIDYPSVWRACRESFKEFEVNKRSFITYKESYKWKK